MDSQNATVHEEVTERGKFESGPFHFTISSPQKYGEVFHIQLENESCVGETFPMRVTVVQGESGEQSPNWYSITFSEEYTGVPMGDYYDIDYRDSITSS